MGPLRHNDFLGFNPACHANNYGRQSPNYHDALAMVVVRFNDRCEKGLGQPVLKLTNQYFTLGLLNGLAIVALAINLWIAFSELLRQKRAQKHLEGNENGITTAKH